MAFRFGGSISNLALSRGNLKPRELALAPALDDLDYAPLPVDPLLSKRDLL
jgi:hypothetical protein